MERHVGNRMRPEFKLSDAAPASPPSMVVGASSGIVRSYAIAILLSLIAAGLGQLLRNLPDADLSFCIPLAAVAFASMIGGFGPGVLATALLSASAAHGQFLPPPKAMQYLCEAGLIMSVVSGQVHAAQRRARQSDAATLDLEKRVLEVSDEERRRIGHDLHDGLGQHLTGISLLSKSLAQRIASIAPEQAHDAQQISTLVTESIGWTRDLARGLSPVTLEDEGLFAALEELSVNARSLLRIECDLRTNGDEPPMDLTSAMHVFRIVQEAVSNSVKHGKAKKVWIDIGVDDHTLTAKVTDNGSGLSAKTRANPGLGLRIMNYRSRMVGATLGIEKLEPSTDRSRQQSGTIITVRCPLAAMTR